MRGISDPIQPAPEPEAEISNEEIMQFLDEVAMMVRDIDTRLSTLERNLLTPKRKFLDGK